MRGGRAAESGRRGRTAIGLIVGVRLKRERRCGRFPFRPPWPDVTGGCARWWSTSAQLLVNVTPSSAWRSRTTDRSTALFAICANAAARTGRPHDYYYHSSNCPLSLLSANRSVIRVSIFMWICFQIYMSQDAYRPATNDEYMLDESVRDECARVCARIGGGGGVCVGA